MEKRMNSFLAFLPVCFFLFSVLCHSSSHLDDYVSIYNEKNFDSKVQKYRNSKVFIIYVYRPTSEAEEFMSKELNPLAEDVHGMINVGKVNCDEWKKFCEHPDVKTVPTLLIYPANRLPPFPYLGKLKKDLIKYQASIHIPKNNVRILDKSSVDLFLSENPSIPKVILFSKKENPNSLYYALGNAFEKKLAMGFVSTKNETNAVLLGRWKIKDLPHLMVIRNDKKIETYKGEIKYRNMHDWLNIFSETFVTGGGYSDADSSATARPWAEQKIPEVTDASHQHICFKKGKGLCVIYLKNGQSITGEEVTMLEELQAEFTSHVSDRGINFRWMWMDLAIEKNFAEMLSVTKYPSVVVFNAFKRLRYTKIDTEATKEAIESLLHKIAGGDARFTNVPDQKLPPFAERNDAAKKQKREEL